MTREEIDKLADDVNRAMNVPVISIVDSQKIIASMQKEIYDLIRKNSSLTLDLVRANDDLFYQKNSGNNYLAEIDRLKEEKNEIFVLSNREREAFQAEIESLKGKINESERSLSIMSGNYERTKERLEESQEQIMRMTDL